MTSRLSAVLGGWLARADFRRAVAAAAVVHRWAEIVGPAVAQHTWAETVRRGILTVRVDSGVWATELAAHEPGLLEKLNEGLDEPVIIRLRFLTGALSGRRGDGSGAGAGRPAGKSDLDAARSPWPRRSDLEGITMTDVELARVSEIRETAGDPDLGRAAATWLTATLKAGRWLERESG